MTYLPQDMAKCCQDRLTLLHDTAERIKQNSEQQLCDIGKLVKHSEWCLDTFKQAPQSFTISKHLLSVFESENQYLKGFYGCPQYQGTPTGMSGTTSAYNSIVYSNVQTSCDIKWKQVRIFEFEKIQTETHKEEELVQLVLKISEDWANYLKEIVSTAKKMKINAIHDYSFAFSIRTFIEKIKGELKDKFKITSKKNQIYKDLYKCTKKKIDEDRYKLLIDQINALTLRLTNIAKINTTELVSPIYTEFIELYSEFLPLFI